jgi:hypothetical protein
MRLTEKALGYLNTCVSWIHVSPEFMCLLNSCVSCTFIKCIENLVQKVLCYLKMQAQLTHFFENVTWPLFALASSNSYSMQLKNRPTVRERERSMITPLNNYRAQTAIANLDLPEKRHLWRSSDSTIDVGLLYKTDKFIKFAIEILLSHNIVVLRVGWIRLNVIDKYGAKREIVTSELCKILIISFKKSVSSQVNKTPEHKAFLSIARLGRDSSQKRLFRSKNMR